MHTILSKIWIDLNQILWWLMIPCAVNILITIHLNTWRKEISLGLLLSSIVGFIISKIINCNVLIYYLTSIMLQRGLWIQRMVMLQCTNCFWILLKHICVSLYIQIGVNYHAVSVLSKNPVFLLQILFDKLRLQTN